MDTLQQLVLRQSLVDNYNAYAEGLDTRNWAMVRDCFAEQVTIDYGDLEAGEARLWSADDWISHIKAVLSGFDSTHHAITNHRMALADGKVICRAYLVADHVILPDPKIAQAGPDNICTVVGEYHNHYDNRADGAWRIVYSSLKVKWSSGNAAIFVTAAERAAASARS